MTTRVIIKCASAHNDIEVSTVEPASNTETVKAVLADQEEIELYVYDTQQILIKEVEKKNVVE